MADLSLFEADERATAMKQDIIRRRSQFTFKALAAFVASVGVAVTVAVLAPTTLGFIAAAGLAFSGIAASNILLAKEAATIDIDEKHLQTVLQSQNIGKGIFVSEPSTSKSFQDMIRRERENALTNSEHSIV
ncbi:MAG: hypothetical protein SFT92_07410 [Rickettsiales bacterium]|nr:hypothetical protein [Rickettsiales bacterium]